MLPNRNVVDGSTIEPKTRTSRFDDKKAQSRAHMFPPNFLIRRKNTGNFSAAIGNSTAQQAKFLLSEISVFIA